MWTFFYGFYIYWVYFFEAFYLRNLTRLSKMIFTSYGERYRQRNSLIQFDGITTLSGCAFPSMVRSIPLIYCDPTEQKNYLYLANTEDMFYIKIKKKKNTMKFLCMNFLSNLKTYINIFWNIKKIYANVSQNIYKKLHLNHI